MNTAGRRRVTCALCGCEWAPIRSGNPERCRRCKSKQWRGRQPHGNLRPNAVRIAGDVAIIDVSTRKLPNTATVIDAADLGLVMDGAGRWLAVHAKNSRTAYVMRKRRPEYASEFLHRRLLGLSSGRDGVVDHVNGDGLDNRRCNIRRCTQSENMANQAPVRGGASRFKGVVQCRSTGRWMAQIKVRGIRKYLGRFVSEEAAAAAYDEALRDAFGEYARTNFQAAVPR